MADDQMTFVVAARDNASTTVKGIRGLLNDTAREAKNSLLTGVGIGGGIAAFNALSGAVRSVAGYMGDAVAAAQADEASIALLTTAIRENDEAWDGNSAAIEKTVSARQRLGFADEEQRSSLGALVAVTKDHNKALDLQRVAMDLARLKGMDLETATTLLGKVYGGNLGILARYGIQLKEGATATEAIAEIQKRAAGQAEAFAESSAGAAAAAGIAFEELQEQIGYKLLPLITELAKFARDTLIPALSTLVDVASEVGDALGWVNPLRKAMEEATPKITEFNTEFLNGESILSAWANGVQRAMTGGVKAVAEGTTAIVSDVGAMTGEMADAMLAGQFEIKDATSQLVKFMEQAISPAQEMLNARAFLGSQAYKDGLASGIPSVRAKARELGEAAAAALNKPLPVSAGGAAVGSSWINAMIGAVRYGRQTLQQEMNEIRNLMGHSLPTKGPLAGMATRLGGLAIGRSWVTGISDGIRGQIGNITAAMPSLGMGGAIRGPAALGAGGGGNGLTVIFQTSFPPSPSQANGIAQSIGPELERWRRQQGLS